jgi:hypothetical protein
MTANFNAMAAARVASNAARAVRYTGIIAEDGTILGDDGRSFSWSGELEPGTLVRYQTMAGTAVNVEVVTP